MGGADRADHRQWVGHAAHPRHADQLLDLRRVQHRVGPAVRALPPRPRGRPPRAGGGGPPPLARVVVPHRLSTSARSFYRIASDASAPAISISLAAVAFRAMAG